MVNDGERNGRRNAVPDRRRILLGKYEIGRLLGEGSFAKVYRARSVHTGQNVAIKVLSKDYILSRGLARHVLREIAILRRVRHPNIVQLFEVMATKSKIFFVMEFVRGGELLDKIAKGRLKEEVARKYFQQLISAVGFCHSRGVYHRDIKPENLLLDENGNLKVSDFGLSAVSDQIREDGLFHTTCGTPAYLAPEVLKRKGYDAASADIWACGVVLFQLMTGTLPSIDRNVVGIYRRVQGGEFRCPRWFNMNLAKLFFSLLDQNPATRIKIPQIMEDGWFKKGFRPIRFYVENDQIHFIEDVETSPSESENGSDLQVLPRPVSLNAFNIITFSSGLSGLLEEKVEEKRFLSGKPASEIIARLEEIAKNVGFTSRKRNFQMNIVGTKEGEKGPLAIGVEIFELTPSLLVLEVKKKAGHDAEYEDFCSKELEPRLRNLIHNSHTTIEASTAEA